MSYNKTYRFKDVNKMVALVNKDGSDLNRRLGRITKNFTKDFTVSKTDSEDNIIAILIDDNYYSADKGEFDEYWCLFLRDDVERLLKEVDIVEDKDFWVITKAPTDLLINGPFTKNDSTLFAEKQIRNAGDHCTVFVTQTIGEAKLNFEIK